MEVKVLKNITHQGIHRWKGEIFDLVNADIERLLASGHITDQITEEDRKAVAAGKPAPTPQIQQQSQEQQAEAASPTVQTATITDVNPAADTQPASDQTQPEDTATQTDDTKNTTGNETQPDNTHTVLEGETLASIAETFGVTVDELASANNIPVTSTVEPGVILTIPQENE